MPDRDAGKSLPEVVQELWELVVSYFKQETVEPVKGLGRFIAAGVAGSLLLGIGLILLALSGLRLMQTEWPETFDGDLTFLPYLIVLVVAALIAVIAVSRISKGRRARS